jgi:hypothetical protein
VRVSLSSDLFVPPIEHSLIATLFRYALDGRHRIDADLQHPLIRAWLNDQSSALQEEIQFAIDITAEAEALDPSHTRAVVGVFANNDWGTHPIHIRIDDARRFLETPFAVLLEDNVTDRDFLLKMLTSQERQFVEKQVQEGFLRFDHGGGLDNMRKKVTEDAANGATRHIKWVLFDSDALRPGEPSNQSEQLRAACGDIPNYQLRRRHSESYLTHEALRLWAASGGPRAVREVRFAKLRAFLRMQDEQRHHFNMKDGFEKDAKREDASAGDLYADLTGEDTRQLAHGFGGNIKALFSGATVTEGDLRRDSGWNELRPVLTQLLARMR